MKRVSSFSSLCGSLCFIEIFITMRLGNKFSPVGERIQSRFQKGCGGLTLWLELEFLGCEELIWILYNVIKGGSWTVDSKVPLMCKNHSYQQADFVFFNRIEVETDVLRAYSDKRIGIGLF